jgi:transcriptional regulator with XRE-family HTH domain
MPLGYSPLVRIDKAAIRAAIKSTGETHAELAARFGCNRSNIAELARAGDRRVRFNLVKAVAEAAGVPVKSLVAGGSTASGSGRLDLELPAADTKAPSERPARPSSADPLAVVRDALEDAARYRELVGILSPGDPLSHPAAVARLSKLVESGKLLDQLVARASR